MLKRACHKQLLLCRQDWVFAFNCCHTLRLMHTYNTYYHPQKGQVAVRLGFAWPAVYLGCIWMFSNVLWRRGLVWLMAYAILWGLALSVVPATGGTLQTLVVCSLALMLSTLWLLPAFFGHLWCELALARAGYERCTIEYAHCARVAATLAAEKQRRSYTTMSLLTS